VALLFGAERTGLTNEDLEVAHLLIRIRAHESYLSLNLAMAVQIMAYELFCARDRAPAAEPRAVPLATASELALLYEHWAAVLEEVDFRDRTESGTHLMARLRRLLQRAEPDKNEVNILRGFLTAVQKRRRPAGARRS
jgi:TrmH family RNA methyltransferase